MSKTQSPAKHTPWHIVVEATAYGIVVGDPRVGKEPVTEIARAWNRDIANLVAAAPELLEALKAALADSMENEGGGFLEPVDAQVRAAIAKAEGVLPETGTACEDNTSPEATPNA